MALSIKDPDVDQMARELADLTGETITETIKKSLQDRLKREKIRQSESVVPLREELAAIRKRLAALPDLDERSPDEILGYDEHGLPT